MLVHHAVSDLSVPVIGSLKQVMLTETKECIFATNLIHLCLSIILLAKMSVDDVISLLKLELILSLQINCGDNCSSYW